MDFKFHKTTTTIQVEKEGKKEDKKVSRYFVVLPSGVLLEFKPVFYKTKKGYQVNTYNDFDLLCAMFDKDGE